MFKTNKQEKMKTGTSKASKTTTITNNSSLSQQPSSSQNQTSTPRASSEKILEPPSINKLFNLAKQKKKHSVRLSFFEINVSYLILTIYLSLRMAIWIRIGASIYPGEKLNTWNLLIKNCGIIDSMISAFTGLTAFLHFLQLCLVMVMIVRRTLNCLKLCSVLQLVNIYVDLLFAMWVLYYMLRSCYQLGWATAIVFLQMLPTILWLFYLHFWFSHAEMISYLIRSPLIPLKELISERVSGSDSDRKGQTSEKLLTAKVARSCSPGDLLAKPSTKENETKKTN
ncbi:unnamed protein product, partial [Mesorhabditis belari]|uniref:Transmembrane protein n=1 Tax=Mesorhabditis belari TaxID=2138241 RepID=A0AAF3FMJ6_9BILA